MKLDDFVAISSLTGVYRLAANRSNGLIVEDLDTGKKRFVSARKHQFTPLASIGIYTDDDTAEMKKVFSSMLEQIEDNPPPAANAPADDLTAYFAKILPEYDRDRVYVSDIKKVLKWFAFLNDRDLLSLEEEDADAGEDTSEEDKANVKDESASEKDNAETEDEPITEKDKTS